MGLRFVVLSILAVALSLSQLPAGAQTAGAGAQASHSGRVPRTRDGKPDLSGIWQALNTANDNLLSHSASKGHSRRARSGRGRRDPVPAGGAARKGGELRQSSDAGHRVRNATCRACRASPTCPSRFRLFRCRASPRFWYEYVHAIRYVYTNGSPHPAGAHRVVDGGLARPLGGGHAGRRRRSFRRGDLVRQDRHFPQRRAARRRAVLAVDADHIDYEVTIEDPKVFTRPWKMRMVLYRHTEPNFQLLDYDCYAFEWEKYYPYPGLWSRSVPMRLHR